MASVADAREHVAPATGRPAPAAAPAGPATLALFTASAFLGAFLLFLIEPMVTKMLLPQLGGSAAVWNVAMVFFQIELLGGYAFAHISITRLGTRRQPILQIACLVLPLLVLPVAVPTGWHPPAEGTPAGWLLLMLSLMVGAPFLMLSTCAPTLQRWFGSTTHPRSTDPYFLYAAGNVGSLLALLAYPLLLEPNLSLEAQSRVWTVGYVAFVVACLACAITLARRRAGDVEHLAIDAPTISWRRRGKWIALAAIPSALMLGVTHHISTDVASMPLLWVLPLGLYLITFIVAFGRRPERSVRLAARALKLLVIPLTLSMLGLVSSLWLTLALHLITFFAAALVAHGRIAADRPEVSRLTEFYALLSVGGVVGGMAAALVAPVVFTSVLEYPLAIVLSLMVLPASAFAVGPRPFGRAGDGEQGEAARPVRAVALGIVVLVLAVASVLVRSNGEQAGLTAGILIAAVAGCLAYVLATTSLGYALAIGALVAAAFLVPAQPTTHAQRTFFGVYRVYDDQTHPGRHVLLNGTTVHGIEDLTGANAGQPSAYYHRTGPIGQYFDRVDATRGPLQIGIVGLGTGALAAYGRPGDHLHYYEIDRAVVDIATDRRLFTYLPDSRARIDVTIGDGRLELEQDRGEAYDLLVIDAFSGDAIPIHLMTDEALALYRRRLAPGGVLAFHISNRYFDFAPILARLARAQGMVGVIQDDPAVGDEIEQGKFDSTWVLMAADVRDLAPLIDRRWLPLTSQPDAPLWTDSYSDVLHAFRWQG